MRLNFSKITILIVSVALTFIHCQLKDDGTDQRITGRVAHQSLLVKQNIISVPTSNNVTTTATTSKPKTISQNHSAQRRSDNDDDGRHTMEDETQTSLFKSLIPKSPFKKPIKKIFRSWFEPDPEALNEDSGSSTFYFTRSKSNILHSNRNVLNNNNNNNNNLNVDSSISHTSRIIPSKHSNFINRVQYSNSYANHDYSVTNNGYRALSRSQPPPQFSIGDPANGRGMTISFGDSPQSNEPTYSQPNEQPQYSQVDSNGGHRGLSLSFGRHAGSGMSFNLGRGNSDNRGMSVSFGDTGGGSGVSLTFGGNSGRYKQSGSSSYPAYSYSSGSNYGYSNNNYGYNNYDYYPPQPLFSLVMPSMGKTVMEMNQHPPKLKMKINSSPKVKITTNTKDPLEKPPLEDEPIMEDIFGPPAPFEKPGKNQTGSNETLPGMHNMTAFMNQTMFPYPYPYYPYTQYYQYPYNYYYNYYHQYPANYYNYMNGSMSMFAAQTPQPHQTQPPSSSYVYHQYAPNAINGQVNPASTSITYTPMTSSNVYVMNVPQRNNNNNPTNVAQTQVQYTYTYPHTETGGWQPTSQQQQQQQQQSINPYQVPAMTIIDNNSLGYKRSSASRNYQKDMLTLSTNSLASSYQKRKPIYSVKRNWKHFSDPMQTDESKTYPHYGMRINYTNPMALMSPSYNFYQYPQYGTGAGYSFFNTSSYYNGTYWSPYNYYFNPYYYNYYNNYYNYAKKYYDAYYGNYTSSYYKKNRTSISGYNQNSFDYHQSKIFGSRTIKYPGGSTKEEKARIIFDVRPRVTIKMLNKTEQMMQDEELKKKKKDHIFKTKMTIIMESTTTKPYYDYNSYYGYNYGPEEDEFGYTHEPPYATTTPTPKPKPRTTTRRRTTTTEAPTSQEFSDEENGTGETTSSEVSESEEEDRSSTTESTDVESVSEETDDEVSKEETTTPVTSTTSESIEGEGDEEEVIEGNEEEDKESQEDSGVDQEKSGDDEKSEDEEKTTNGEESETSAEENEEEEEKPSTEDNNGKQANNVTVAPELVAAMIRALQEALGVTTTPLPPISTLKPFDEIEESKLNKNDENSQENDIVTTSITRKSKPTAKPKGGRRRIPTNVISTTVKNTTQLRLKTPVLNIQPRTTAASNAFQRIRTFPNDILRNSKEKENKMVTKLEEITTTSPLIISKVTKNWNSAVNKVIDGNALLSNFDVNNLTDDERRDMLTNILNVIQTRSNSDSMTSTTPKLEKKLLRKKSGKIVTATTTTTKLLPVTKANNVRIISSLEELNNNNNNNNSEKSTNNQPIYVVLLPQNKKKK